MLIQLPLIQSIPLGTDPVWERGRVGGGDVAWSDPDDMFKFIKILLK